MSLILDAINRSQRERANPGEVPGVATVHYAEATVAPSAWRQSLLGLALIVVLGGIAWLLLRPAPVVVEPGPAAPAETQEPQPQQQAQEKQLVQVGPGKAVPATPKPAASRQEAAKPAAKDQASVAVDDHNSSGTTEPSAEVSALYTSGKSEDPARGAEEASSPVPSTGNRKSSPAESTAVRRKAPAATEEEALDVGELVARARAEMRNASLQEHPAPFLNDLSQQRKDAIPTLLYSQHDFRGDGGTSTVMINGKTASEGQSLGKGVGIEEILPDSVVLTFAGEPFRLKALNSWVNL